MHPSVYVRILLEVETVHRLDDRPGLLARGRIIQIDQRLAVHLLFQNRKICPDPRDIERGTDRVRNHDIVKGSHVRSRVLRSVSRRWWMIWCRRSRTGVILIRSMTSPANASIRISRAWSARMPQERR